MAGKKGRWCYVILVASFLTLFFNTSMNYAVGVINAELLRYYRSDVITTAWLGALFGCMFSLAGPVASSVIGLWGCRVSVVAGSIFTLVGFASSSLVQDIRLLFLTYALLAGLGQVLTHAGAMVVLGYHFPDHMSLVVGVANAGAGFGVFVHPSLTQFLIDVYGLQGAFLLLGAISLHALPCGLLMRPASPECKTPIPPECIPPIPPECKPSGPPEWKPSARPECKPPIPPECKPPIPPEYNPPAPSECKPSAPSECILPIPPEYNPHAPSECKPPIPPEYKHPAPPECKRPTPLERRPRGKRTPPGWIKKVTQIYRSATCGHLGVLGKFSFDLFLVSDFCLAMAVSTIYLYMPAHFVESGSTPEAAAFAVSMSGIGGMLSRLLLGVAANDPGIHSLTLFFSSIGITGVVTLALPQFSRSVWGQYCFGLLLGLYTGGCWSLQLPLTKHMVGLVRMAGAFGFVMMAGGLGYLVGPPLAGLIAEYTGNYYDTFLFPSCMLFFSSFCAMLSSVFLGASRDGVRKVFEYPTTSAAPKQHSSEYHADLIRTPDKSYGVEPKMKTYYFATGQKIKVKAAHLNGSALPLVTSSTTLQILPPLTNGTCANKRTPGASEVGSEDCVICLQPDPLEPEVVEMEDEVR